MGQISVNIVQRKIFLQLKGGVSWIGIIGKPLNFPPAAHDHNAEYFTKQETTDYIALGLAGLVDVAPEWLNTLAELSEAINNDPDFYNSIIALLSGKAPLEHTQSQATIVADPFQTPVFANPLILDATTHKDFKPGLIAGDTTINLENTNNGESGVIEIFMDGVGGYAVALGAMFTANVTGNAINSAANKKNYIFWYNDGVDINYSIVVL